MRYVRVQQTPFDPNQEVDLLRHDHPAIGAVVTFLGLMRDLNDDRRVERLFLEHYPGMTEQALERIVAEAADRWELQGCRLIHRVGELTPTEPIVLVAVATCHRREAFQACEFIIDYLKIKAPFWKRETRADGTTHWVASRIQDLEASQRWF
jgi:molybdopterin synthase catalytic subunit